MVFSSVVFLFLFLPLALATYFLVPVKWKNALLLLLSLVFYTWGEGKLVLVMLTSTAIDFFCARMIEKGQRKWGLLISILTNLSVLGFFKYFNFSLENARQVFLFIEWDTTVLSTLPCVTLPLGISFYTLQSMSYTIDVYRGKIKANRSFIDFAAYVTMFPQLVAGPIVRYADIREQLHRKLLSLGDFAKGMERFILGLAKKVLIANSMATIADDIMAQDQGSYSGGFAWLALLAYTFQIYYDFSGYSDMAIGLGRMLGFRFPENFRHPYVSRSIREFWRRWHISLSSWFRDYLYISLGGSRRTAYRTYLNLLIVFFTTGLWHGASWNFVVWGLFHGVFIVLERLGGNTYLQKAPRLLQHGYTLIVVMLAWVFFRIEDFPESLRFMASLFTFPNGTTAMNSYLQFYHLNMHTLSIMLLAAIFSAPLYRRMRRKLLRTNRYIYTILVALLFVVTLIYLSADTYNPFIYFRF